MAESSAVPPWLDLPQDITAAMLHKLGPVEILRTAQLVCTQWWSVCRDPSMWRCIQMSREGGLVRSEKICCYAVDRSQGQLIDISIQCFGSDYLLLYISQKSSNLRRLQLTYTHEISSEGIIEAIKNLPLLEELHLYLIDMDAEAIEAIGRSCPLLKSFKLNQHCYYEWECVLEAECDLEARAIAQYMPELRHLQLIGNGMTDEGVQAIINGCSHIESLDLRECFNVHFGGDIEILCSKRIKDLRRPHDLTYDYPFDVKTVEDYIYEDYIYDDSMDTMSYDLMMQEWQVRYDLMTQELQVVRRSEDPTYDYPFDSESDEDYIDELTAYDNMVSELRLDEYIGSKKAKSLSRRRKKKYSKNKKTLSLSCDYRGGGR